MRESIWRRIWNCIYPAFIMILIYIAAYLAAVLIYSSFLASSGRGLEDFMSEYGNFISIVAISLGGLFMYFLYKKDIVIHSNYILKNPIWFVPVVIVGILASHGLSILVSLMNIDNIIGSYSESVQTVLAGDTAIAVLKSVVLASLAEEVLFRGVIFNRAKKYWGFWPASLISSALFGIYHLNLAQGVYAFIYAVLLCLVYDCFKNLWVPVSMHAGANAFSLILSYAGVSYPAVWVYIAVMTAALAATIFIYIFIIRKSIPKVAAAMEEEKHAAGF